MTDRDPQPDGGHPAGATDPTYAEWRQHLWEDQVLLGQRCHDCGHATAAPKAACAQCGSRSIERIDLPPEGEVYARTRIEIAPAEFDGPYTVALVDLGEARVLARLTGEREIGESVTLTDVYEGDLGPAPVFG
ncbi:Zn-ribbon domain-containing OB-fold protein [Salinarchaeum laminariae]|uniref:Zn-ribbon domain-containing OB-fold protein n=1 Tax=Salinarchaeum laminariae TaxID=869888 RepID=UPI0020BFB793|nr:OB-fold domain-containing protein [Salinarchaeum laminariae]